MQRFRTYRLQGNSICLCLFYLHTMDNYRQTTWDTLFVMLLRYCPLHTTVILFVSHVDSTGCLLAPFTHYYLPSSSAVTQRPRPRTCGAIPTNRSANLDFQAGLSK